MSLRRDGATSAYGAAARTSGALDEVLEGISSYEKTIEDFEDPACHLLVAVSRGTVVGTALLRQQRDEAELSACYCSVQGHGIGSALMTARLTLAAEMGSRLVWLEVDEVNAAGAAHALRHGFTPVSERYGRFIKDHRVTRYELKIDP